MRVQFSPFTPSERFLMNILLGKSFISKVPKETLLEYKDSTIAISKDGVVVEFEKFGTAYKAKLNLRSI